MGSGGIVNWIMLNPSTADERFDDPTIRKCCGFAKRWGYRGITVSNLFAFRATDPADLIACAAKDYGAAVGGGETNCQMAAEAWRADLVVIAWGAHAKRFPERVREVLDTVLVESQLFCIGRTKEGHPLHPCMAPYIDHPIPFVRVVAEAT